MLFRLRKCYLPIRRPTTDDRRPTTDDRRPTTDDRRPTEIDAPLHPIPDPNPEP
ncbi:MAG: hypothetical protein ACJ8CR_13685 [Roseiflexaceae bacterium]